jgi:hypothetical protein
LEHEDDLTGARCRLVRPMRWGHLSDG